MGFRRSMKILGVACAFASMVGEVLEFFLIGIIGYDAVLVSCPFGEAPLEFFLIMFGFYGLYLFIKDGNFD